MDQSPDHDIPAASTPVNGAAGAPGNGRRGLRRRLSRWFARRTLTQKLVAAALALVFAPLWVYAGVSMRFERRSAEDAAVQSLDFAVRSLLRLCQAQEALTRLHQDAAGLDGVSGATRSWQEGGQYKSLQEIIREVHVSSNGESLVFDGGGRVRVHPTWTDRNLLEGGPNADLFRRLRDEAREMPQGGVAVRELSLVGDDGRQHLRLTALGYFPPFDWVLVVWADQDDVLGAYYESRRGFITVLALTALLVVGLVYGAVRILMKPIVALTAATERVARGEFDIPAPRVVSEDEIGRLSLAFRTMTGDLKESHQALVEWNRTLEQRVEARARELETARDRIIEAERMGSLGRMSAIVAHEINNPLSGVLSYVKVCRKLLTGAATPDRDEKLVRYLDNSAHEIARVGEIVKNLLVFSRRSFGARADKPLNEIVDRAASLMRHGMDMKNVTLELDLAATELAVINADASAIEQMIVAFLVNALDAVESGGTIGIETIYADKDHVTIAVRDTGHGIEPDLLPHIFEPFFTGKSEGGKNIGMGLSVVWGVVQSHHGTVRVESQVGVGTKFIVTLPLKPPPEAASETRGAM